MYSSEHEGMILPDINARKIVAEDIYHKMLITLGGKSQIQKQLPGGFYETYHLPHTSQLLDFVSFREDPESPPRHIQTTANILLPPLREPPNSLASWNYLQYKLSYLFMRQEEQPESEDGESF